jgi:hypothetical protein
VPGPFNNPMPPPQVPGVTETGQPQPDPVQMLLKMLMGGGQSDLAKQDMREAIERLRSAAQKDPAYERSVGEALRALTVGGSQAGPPASARGGQFGQVIGPVESSSSSWSAM